MSHEDRSVCELGHGTGSCEAECCSLTAVVLLNTMIAFAGENRELEAGDGNQV